MPKFARPRRRSEPMFGFFMPDGRTLGAALRARLRRIEDEILAGADARAACGRAEADLASIVRHAFAWAIDGLEPDAVADALRERCGALPPGALEPDPDAHAAAGEAAEAARLDGLEAEREAADAERDGTPLRGPISATAASLRATLRDVDGLAGTPGAATAAELRAVLGEAVDALEAIHRLPGFLPVADPSPEHRALLDARNLARIGLHRAAAAAGTCCRPCWRAGFRTVAPETPEKGGAS